MDNQNTISTLINFINAAEKSRKYSKSTAKGLRVALRLFEPELNEEEKKSIKIFGEHIDQIYREVFNKNLSKMTASSIATYRSRVNRVLGQYKKYGEDPTKIASWEPAKRVIREKSATQPKDVKSQNFQDLGNKSPSNGDSHEIKFSADRQAMVITPRNITKPEIKRLRAYLQYLEDSCSVDDSGGVTGVVI